MNKATLFFRVLSTSHWKHSFRTLPILQDKYSILSVPHSFALGDGKVLSWGYGLLGNSSDACCSAVPQNVTYFDERVVSIACGLGFYAAVTGTLFVGYSICVFQNLISNSWGKFTKQISTMTVTLYLIKLIDVRKNTNEHRILYKRTWDFILKVHPN